MSDNCTMKMKSEKIVSKSFIQQDALSQTRIPDEGSKSARLNSLFLMIYITFPNTCRISHKNRKNARIASACGVSAHVTSKNICMLTQ